MARSLKECRRRGWFAGVVEQTIPRTFIKRDLFGAIDIVAISPEGAIGIQATTGEHHAARLSKALALPAIAAWIRAGQRFEVWSWSKRGANGKRKVWQLRAQSVSRECFTNLNQEMVTSEID